MRFDQEPHYARSNQVHVRLNILPNIGHKYGIELRQRHGYVVLNDLMKDAILYAVSHYATSHN